MSSLIGADPASNGGEGEARKREAHCLLAAHRERLIRLARRALLAHLIANDTGTIDDVRKLVPTPVGVNPKAFGAVPGPLALARIISAAGLRKTTRSVGHARPVTVWTVTDRHAASAWILAHPELPEPGADDPADPFAA